MKSGTVSELIVRMIRYIGTPKRFWAMAIIFCFLASSFGNIVYLDPVVSDQEKSSDKVMSITSWFPSLHTLTIWCSNDTTVYQGDPNINDGMGDYLIISSGTKCLLNFNLSQLPGDSVFISVIMKLYSFNDSYADVGRLLGSWNEMDATWNNMPSSVSSPDTKLSNVHVPVGTATFNITSFMKGWFQELYPNYGMIMSESPLTPSNHTLFMSKERAFTWGDPANHTPRLIVTYCSQSQNPPQQFPPPKPTIWWDDVTPPQISIACTSPTMIANPPASFTFAIDATDDMCIGRVLVFRLATSMEKESMISDIRVPYSDQHNTSVHIVVNVEFDYFGGKRIAAYVYDRNGHMDYAESLVWVGTGTRPIVELNHPWHVFANDTSNMTISISADDPEGIKRIYMRMTYTHEDIGVPVFDYSSGMIDHVDQHYCKDYGVRTVYEFDKKFENTPTHATIEVNIRNKNLLPADMFLVLSHIMEYELYYGYQPNAYGYEHLSINPFELYVIVDDREGMESREYSQIENIVPYQWVYGFTEANFKTKELTWDQMYDVFGFDECTYSITISGEKHYYNTPLAEFWYRVFKGMADKGDCFGMSASSAYYANRGFPYSQRYMEGIDPHYDIECHQGSQMSEELIDYSLLLYRKPYSDFVKYYIPNIISDIENHHYGVLCVGEGDEAHALVPWHVDELGTGNAKHWRIYVYDCNRPDVSRPDFNLTVDQNWLYFTMNSDVYNNSYINYPYVDVWHDKFRYEFSEDISNPEIWNDKIFYMNYDKIWKSDYDLWNSGAVSAAIIVTIISGGLALAIGGLTYYFMKGGDGDDIKLVQAPINASQEAVIKGNESGNYTFFTQIGHSYLGIMNKSCAKNCEDRMNLIRNNDKGDFSLRIRSGTSDKDFFISLGREIDGKVRDYMLRNASIGTSGDLEIGVSPDNDSMKLINRGTTDVSGTVVLRSAASNTLGMISLVIHPGEEITVTGDWSNLSASPLQVKSESIGGGVDTIVIIIVGMLCLVAAVAIVVYIRKRQKGNF